MLDKFVLAPRADFGALGSGMETFPRSLAQSVVGQNTGQLRLGYFTKRGTETFTQVRMDSATTAAGATPTLCRIGIYSEAATGALTLIGSTVNDTTLFAAVTTAYVRSWSASVTLSDGVRYAIGALVVTGAAAPNTAGINGAQSPLMGPPKMAAAVSSLADLPSTVAVGSLGNSGGVPWAVLL